VTQFASRQRKSLSQDPHRRSALSGLFERRNSGRNSHTLMFHAPVKDGDLGGAPVHAGGCGCGGQCSTCRARSQTFAERALANPGRPLEPRIRAFMEPRLGHNLNEVRVHDDEAAARSAAALQARAWTLGRDIVFGRGMYAPDTPRGAGLLAHELAHVAQQRNLARSTAVSKIAEPGSASEREAEQFALSVQMGRTPERLSRVREPWIQRSALSAFLDFVLFIPRLFGLAVFPAEDLREYLDRLKKRKSPEDGLFSDNMARACVNRESEFGPYDTQTKILLIQEMLGGHVSRFDEGSIIELLRRSPSESAQIVSTIGRDHLWSKFDGGNRRIIEALTMTAADAGDALVTRLRSLSPHELQDYSANVVDPKVRESVQKAIALREITTPVPVEAQVSSAGVASLVINGVNVTILPDRINPALDHQAFTHGIFSGKAPGKIEITPANANVPMGPINPPENSIEIFTEYPSMEQKSEKSAYGVGTRPGDVNTLQTHERAHGEAWLRFLRETPPPAARFTNNMLPTDYNAEVERWNAAFDAWKDQAEIYALKAGDCVGTLPTDEQYRGTRFTAAICHQQ
jgi:hypothetical protein